MTITTIKALEAKGATRWTKGDHDRLYLNGLAREIIGLEVNRYKSGSISSATVGGETISNAAASRILSAIDSAYIDLKTGTLHLRTIEEKVGGCYTDLSETIKTALTEMTTEKAQGGSPEPSAETSAEETRTTTTVQETTEESKEDTMKKTYKGYTYYQTTTTTDVRYQRGDTWLTRISRLYEIVDLKPHGKRPFLTSEREVKDFISAHVDGEPPVRGEVPQRIQTARSRRGMTQRELGEAMGYSGEAARITVARWEAGTRPVPMDKVAALADVLGVGIRELLP